MFSTAQCRSCHHIIHGGAVQCPKCRAPQYYSQYNRVREPLKRGQVLALWATVIAIAGLAFWLASAFAARMVASGSHS